MALDDPVTKRQERSVLPSDVTRALDQLDASDWNSLLSDLVAAKGLSARVTDPTDLAMWWRRTQGFPYAELVPYVAKINPAAAARLEAVLFGAEMPQAVLESRKESMPQAALKSSKESVWQRLARLARGDAMLKTVLSNGQLAKAIADRADWLLPNTATVLQVVQAMDGDGWDACWGDVYAAAVCVAERALQRASPTFLIADPRAALVSAVTEVKRRAQRLDQLAFAPLMARADREANLRIVLAQDPLSFCRWAGVDDELAYSGLHEDDAQRLYQDHLLPRLQDDKLFSEVCSALASQLPVAQLDGLADAFFPKARPIGPAAPIPLAAVAPSTWSLRDCLERCAVPTSLRNVLLNMEQQRQFRLFKATDLIPTLEKVGLDFVAAMNVADEMDKNGFLAKQAAQ